MQWHLTPLSITNIHENIKLNTSPTLTSSSVSYGTTLIVYRQAKDKQSKSCLPVRFLSFFVLVTYSHLDLILTDPNKFEHSNEGTLFDPAQLATDKFAKKATEIPTGAQQSESDMTGVIGGGSGEGTIEGNPSLRTEGNPYEALGDDEGVPDVSDPAA
ncbi:hypothetical protein G7K_6417-t1 [Saitoella complicata NRRL Y-17804]|uniref:Uncharacterized protein n=1 Tax=Saitoella complicata (strain BCRC 22490 / CBS 7301 / JCM 7358 / NBRC 10748 / NRRL Y-17804) TaxID=698492 RepID=A0A0E9NR50_SAICN|nr:hypothetical protein G7K_6417-t1 [Saitoella complicata NRRL Y-17804]